MWEDGRLLYRERANGGTEIRRLSDFGLLRTIRSRPGEAVSFDDRARRGAAVDRQGVLRLWTDGPNPSHTVRTGLAELYPTDNRFVASPSVQFSPDGTKLLATIAGVGYQVRDAGTLRLLASRRLSRETFRAAWNDDASLILFRFGSTSSTLLDIATGRQRIAPTKEFYGAKSPDGRLRADLVDNSIEIRSVRSDRRLFTLDMGAEAISDVRFSNDGRALQVLLSDRRLRTYRGKL